MTLAAVMTAAVGTGFTDRYLTDAEIGDVVERALETLQVDRRRVLVIVPDLTRTMPLPRMVDLFEAGLGARVAALDYLVALGTHSPLNDAQSRACSADRWRAGRWGAAACSTTSGIAPTPS